MRRIVELDDQGAIHLPEDFRAAVPPHARFALEIHGATLILHPVGEPPRATSPSPADRAAALRHWAALDRPPAPALPDAALGREQIYD